MNRRFRRAYRQMNDDVITTGRPPKTAKVNHHLELHFARRRNAKPTAAHG